MQEFSYSTMDQKNWFKDITGWNYMVLDRGYFLHFNPNASGSAVKGIRYLADNTRKCLETDPYRPEEKNDLELKPPPDLPPTKIDAERIGQEMENLVNNALKFSSERSKMVLKAYVKKDER